MRFTHLRLRSAPPLIWTASSRGYSTVLGAAGTGHRVPNARVVNTVGDSSGRGDRGRPMAILDCDADYLTEGEDVEHPGDGDNVDESGEPNPCESDIENSNQ